MRILAVSDGRRGIDNQVLGLAEAVARLTAGAEITHHIIAHTTTFAALPPSLQLAAKRDFGLPEADIVIGCGRQAIAPLIALQRRGSSAFTAYIQDPRMDASRFDLVIAPEHDGLSGPFVETMIGAPNRITEERIITGTLSEAERLSRLPMPRAAFLIGGNSRTHKMTEANIGDHLSAAKDLRAKGYSLLITTSRRTPVAALNAWKSFDEGADDIWLHTPETDAANPYFAFLGGADLLLITEDSTNMLTEGCSTGKPVIRLPMEGKAGKFATLYEALETRCNVARWNGTVPTKTYPKLDETARVARCLLDRFEASMPEAHQQL